MNSRRVTGRCLGGVLVALGLSACAERVPVRSGTPPVVVGLKDSGLTPRLRGLVLLDELGCTACHHHEPSDPRRGPDLATAGNRVNAAHMVAFVADPQIVEPGTTMPDLLRDLDAEARDRAARSLTHYLRSFAVPPEAARPAVWQADAAARGGVLYHEIGCVACHAPRQAAGSDDAMADSVPLGDLAAKYELAALRAFLIEPHLARPSARMPDLALSPAEAHDLACFLHVADVPEAVAPAVDPVEVAAGRELFAARGCVHCHDLVDPERRQSPAAPPLSALDVDRGCLTGEVGPWPFYSLTATQRGDLVAALGALDEPFDAEARIRQRLLSRNCLSCHERGEIGGVTTARNPHFLSGDPTLGSDGRVPPALTGVGGRLQNEWLVRAIQLGQSERPYLRTRMPAFGREFAVDLADALASADRLPPIDLLALPEDKKEAEAMIDLGRELVGDKGMNCITCHLFAGRKVGAMAAIDLVDSTGQRLRPEWFAHFLRDPFAFKPTTLMPQFFPDGRSTRPEIGDGDVSRQIAAMWHYLAKGRNVRQPRGIRRPPIELEVGDEAVILRRSVQGAGKRGISVGYPSGVSLTFDAENLGLNQIWWGRFIDAAPVWTGQGSGQARILGSRRVSLPNGPAFARLPRPDSPWPDVSRRELGQRWIGYDLDSLQRPSFRYVCEGVEVIDAPREHVSEDGVTALRRELRFLAEGDVTLQFRAARSEQIVDRGDGLFRVGGVLDLQVPSDAARTRADGDEFELIVTIPIVGGRAEIVLEYRWHEEGR